LCLKKGMDIIMKNNKILISVKDLKKTYTTYERGNSFLETVKSLVVRKPIYVDALKGFSFNINKGELIGLIGPNGAGKSTTLKILSGILYPTSGDVKVMDYVPWKHRKRYVSNIGAVFGQKSQLIWDIPPMDSFYMNKAIYDVKDNDFKVRLEELVEILSLKHVINKPTRQLSLGERMKCEFVMAMLHNPPVVFLDEPTIGLDVIAKDVIRNFIKEMNAKGTTFILTTHDLDDIEQLAQRVVVINHGTIVYDDSISSLKNRLGNKKRVKVLLNHNFEEDKVINLSSYKKLSDHELEFVLDTDLMTLKEFFEQLSTELDIKDISVESQDIENVIKELYLA